MVLKTAAFGLIIRVADIAAEETVRAAFGEDF